MGKKKHKDMYDISVEDQLASEKEFAKYFDTNYKKGETKNESHLDSEVCEDTKEASDITENINKNAEGVVLSVTPEEMLRKIISHDDEDDDDNEVSSIFSPEWDKRKRHKASNINSIIKGNKKGKASDLLTDMILNRDDEFPVTETASTFDEPYVIDMSGSPVPEYATSGYIQAYNPENEEEFEYPSSRFLYDDESNSILVFNDYIDADNRKPDITLSLNHLMGTRINMDSSYQFEDIVHDTVELMTLLRKPDFVLSYKGFEKFVSNFTNIDHDLIYIYKMSTCMVTNKDIDPSNDKYLVYVYQPTSNISDTNEVVDLYNIISSIGYKLPSFIQYLSQYLCNPLVSNINDWNHNNRLQLLTLGDHNEEEDCEELIDVLTAPEVLKLYEDNELWTPESTEKPLNVDTAKKHVKFDIQYLDIRIKKLQKKVNLLLGIEEADEDDNKEDCDNESFEDVNSDDLVIDKIITGENRKDD